MSSPEIEIGSVHSTYGGVLWLINEFDKANGFTFEDKHTVENKYPLRLFLVLDYVWHEDSKRVKLLSLNTNDIWWACGFTWLNWFTPLEEEESLEKKIFG